MDVRNSDVEHAIAVAILSAFSAILQGTAIQSARIIIHNLCLTKIKGKSEKSAL
jgi:hypothetical protein